MNEEQETIEKTEEKVEESVETDQIEKTDDKEVIIAGGEIKKFSDVYANQSFDFEGRKAEFDEIFNKEIIIHDFAILPGEFGTFAVVSIKLNDEMITVPLGSEVVREQLVKAKEDGNLPLQGTIVERLSEKSKRKYHTLS